MRLDPLLYYQLKEESLKQGRTLSNLLHTIFKKHLNKGKKNE